MTTDVNVLRVFTDADVNLGNPLRVISAGAVPAGNRPPARHAAKRMSSCRRSWRLRMGVPRWRSHQVAPTAG
jgi:hypothetical protein